MAHEFHSFSVAHWGMLVLLGGITVALIQTGKKASPINKLKLAILISGLTLSIEMLETLVLAFQGRYDYHTDLPLFLCDLAALFLPFVLLYQNRKWIGIFYFWAMGGTLQALITPDLEAGFPTFGFFRYFFMHGGIVITLIYTVVVFHIHIRWRDLVRAVLYAQFYLIAIHLINWGLQTNYSYTIQKPAGPTVLDYFGPWPWYILWGEVLMIVLFLLLWLPFLLTQRTPSDPEPESFGTV